MGPAFDILATNAIADALLPPLQRGDQHAADPVHPPAGPQRLP
ncbi:hypothetical protein [Streptomyces mirabilis]